MLTSMFTRISHEEREIVVAKELEGLNTIAAEKELQEEMVEKRPVGRPKKGTMLIAPSTIKQEEDTRKKNIQHSQKRSQTYNKWFSKDLFPSIQQAVRRYGRTQQAIDFLEIGFRTPGGPSPYQKLGRSSLYDWFDERGELKDNYKEAAALGYHTMKQDQNMPILENYPQIRDELVSNLQRMREAGQTLLISIVQPILKGMIEALAPHLLNDRPGGFKVSKQWTNEFMRIYMNWTIRKGTTAASKLPIDWIEQGLKMNYRVAYLAKLYNIPPSLVVNSDQTGIHLVPAAGGKTWDAKGTKDVKILGMEDKRQITCVMSSSASGELLPIQAIFTGKTSRCLPKQSEEKAKCIELGWHFTFSPNHWSTLHTSQQFVEEVLEPYLASKIALLKLPKDQKLVWIIDSWSVHKSMEFLDWIKSKHPNILVIFVPANCTSKLQPADVILQRPFKHAFKLEFHNWTAAEVKAQIESKGDLEVNLSMSNLKPRIPAWLFYAWSQVKEMVPMIEKGWQKCGFDRCFLPSFQVKAMEVNAETPLFTINPDLEENVEEEDVSDPTIPLMIVVEDCLNGSIEAPTSPSKHGATSRKRKSTSKKPEKRGKQKTLI